MYQLGLGTPNQLLSALVVFCSGFCLHWKEVSSMRGESYIYLWE